MIIRQWAEEFSDQAALDVAARRHIDLHVADTVIAYFAGCRAPEARALAQLHDLESAATGIESRVAAISAMIRRTECDDIHVSSCITPGSIVVPVALAFSAMNDEAGSRFERAVTAGYAIGMRLGLALGGAAALGTGIWPTYFAAPMMAAATASVCLGLDVERIASALGLAAAGAGGRVGRMSGYPSGRWLALGEAVGKGCRAALAAKQGFQGDAGLISPEWLAALADPKFIQPDALLGGSGIEAVGFKAFVAARQTINAVFAFQAILRRNVDPRTIERIEIRVAPVHAAMVAKPAAMDDRLSTIANMHVQIAAAALRPDLLYDIERIGQPQSDLQAFAERIAIIPDATLDACLPSVWAARVKVIAAGQQFEETCTLAPGDPGHADPEAVIRNKLSRMVPTDFLDICDATLGDADETTRARLWREMLAAA